jgi:hypothetical protein
LPLWEDLDLWVSAHPAALVAIAGAALLAGLVVAIAALVAARRLRRRYARLMMNQEGLDLEELLGSHGELLQEGLHSRERIEARLDAAEAQLRSTIAGVALVRYNAFRETGSDLSFSLALLDRDLNGVVLTSLFGRDESRCYGKTIERGEPVHSLSEEEACALVEAKSRVRAQD